LLPRVERIGRVCSEPVYLLVRLDKGYEERKPDEARESYYAAPSSRLLRR
jgi:hypothetical protein